MWMEKVDKGPPLELQGENAVECSCELFSHEKKIARFLSSMDLVMNMHPYRGRRPGI